MRRNLHSRLPFRFAGLFLITATLAVSSELRAEFRLFPKREVVHAAGQLEAREPIELVSFSQRTGCGCRGCCARHSWAPYYCGLESYHRPYYGEPGWRGFWKAEKCGIGRKYDMSCYNCPQGGSW